MGNDHDIRVSIRYLTVPAAEWRQVDIPLEDYLEPDELDAPCLDSVSRWQHAADYLDVEPAQLRCTELRVRDAHSGQHRLVAETLWDEGRSRIIEVTDTRDGYWELIVDIWGGDEGVEHILRYGVVEDRRTLISHSRISRDPDGTERDDPVYSILSD